MARGVLSPGRARDHPFLDIVPNKALSLSLSLSLSVDEFIVTGSKDYMLLCSAARYTTEYVLLLQNMFSYYRICSLTTEYVVQCGTVFYAQRVRILRRSHVTHQHPSEPLSFTHLRQNMFSYDRKCSLRLIPINGLPGKISVVK